MANVESDLIVNFINYLNTTIFKKEVIRSLQLLLPKSSKNINEIYVFTAAKDIKIYNSSIKNFLGLKDSNPIQQRSLYYHRFDEAFKYSTLNGESDEPINDDESQLKYETNPTEKVEINDELKTKLSDSKNMQSDWMAWIKKLSNYGKSTLWGYLEINEFDKFTSQEAISYFVIFDKAFENNPPSVDLIKLNKELNSFCISYLAHIAKLDMYKQATKAAMVAIMARNMSHNLGSHVLFYLKSLISDTPKQLDYFLYELELIENGNFQLTHLKALENKIKFNPVDTPDLIKAPFLRGLGRFIGYLQERQDFIATISNDFIPYYGSVSFKDFIYDELNPDLRIERHGNSSQKNHQEKNLLLEYIAASEKFYRKDIKIFFKDFDGLNKEHDDLKKLRNVRINLPGGIMGRQAFFSIFENFIRNTAKHASREKLNSLEFVIDMDIDTEYSNFYKVKLYEKNNIELRDVVTKISGAIEEVYINNQGGLLPGNKGIKEMRISAAWMRGFSVADINESEPTRNGNNEPPILGIKLVDKNGGDLIDAEEGCLCYEFYVPISNKIVLITEQEKKISDFIKINENLEENKKKELFDHLNKRTDFKIKTFEQYNKGNKNYDIILYDVNHSIADKIKSFSPTKCIPIAIEELKTKFDEFAENFDGKDDELLVSQIISSIYAYYIEDWASKNLGFTSTSDKKQIIIADKNYDPNATIHYSRDKRVFLTNESNEPAGEKLSEIYNNKTFSAKDLILFRTHNDTAKEFENFKNEYQVLYNKCAFIEGISGHNSTDRLIRNSVLDSEWVLKMMVSAYTKILIIDERIFNRISETKSQIKLDYTIEEIPTHSVEKFEQFFKEREPDYNVNELQKFKTVCTIIKNETKYSGNFNSVINKYLSFLFDFLEEQSKSTNSKLSNKKNELQKELLAKKNITVLNFDFNDEIVIKDISKVSIGKFSIPKKEKDENQWSDSFNLNEQFTFSQNHFVLVHQGILDKLYDNAKCKSTKDKQAVFDIFKEIFPIPEGFKYIIHSGRSRPEFLPKNVAFAQFSSVEAAFFDCKFSLNELVYAARNEKNEM